MKRRPVATFLAKVAADSTVRAELVALAARHGMDLGIDTMDDAALDGVAGGGGTVKSLADETALYLKEHPAAQDSADGIAAWWLPKR